jgi:hypothetical protein
VGPAEEAGAAIGVIRERRSFADLAERAHAIAIAAREFAAQGERVLVATSAGLASFDALLACRLAGLVAVPVRDPFARLDALAALDRRRRARGLDGRRARLRRGERDRLPRPWPDELCGVHNWDYCCKTGVSSYNPSERLHRFNSRVEDGKVWVDEDEIRAWAVDNPQPYDRDAYQGLYKDIHGGPEEPHTRYIQHLAEHSLPLTRQPQAVARGFAFVIRISVSSLLK